MVKLERDANEAIQRETEEFNVIREERYAEVENRV
jgi:hypothetical protein